jgi:hypothetical protein
MMENQSLKPTYQQLENRLETMRINSCRLSEILGFDREIQLQQWLPGNSIHDYANNECCPDFSCCNREVSTSQEEKDEFISLHRDGKSKDHLYALFLGRSLQTLGVEVVNMDLIEEAQNERMP